MRQGDSKEAAPGCASGAFRIRITRRGGWRGGANISPGLVSRSVRAFRLLFIPSITPGSVVLFLLRFTGEETEA